MVPALRERGLDYGIGFDPFGLPCANGDHDGSPCLAESDIVPVCTIRLPKFVIGWRILKLLTAKVTYRSAALINTST